MNYQQAYNIVAENKYNRNFDAVIDGKKQPLRLFVSGDYLCQYKKGSKKWGWKIDLNLLGRITSLTPHSKNIDAVKIFRHNLEKIIKHLSASQLWPQILIDAKALLQKSDEQIREWADMDSYELYKITDDFEKNGVLPGNRQSCGLTGEIFCNLFNAKSIKTINYHSWAKTQRIEQFANAIAKRESYSYRWHKGYDNSIEVKEYKGVLQAWYSEEYTGCGNGHYYLALSATHAIFCEDD